MKNKMEFEDLFRESSERSELGPPKILWHRLERRLDRRKYRKRINTYRNISIAAIFICLLSVLFIFSPYLKTSQNQTNQDSPLFIEDLVSIDVESSEIYSSVSELHRIYAIAGLEMVKYAEDYK